MTTNETAIKRLNNLINNTGFPWTSKNIKEQAQINLDQELIDLQIRESELKEASDILLLIAG